MLAVDNLHPSCTATDLRELFSPFGQVLWSRLIVDTNAYAFAYGYIEMASSNDAETAAEALDGTMVLEHLIHVSISSDHIEKKSH